MRALSFAPLLCAAVVQAADYPIQPVPLAEVELTDGFWRARLETNRTVTIPHILKQNESTGRVANFAKAAGRAQGAYQGRRFNDTDVYKIIEAASYSLVSHPDPALSKKLDELIELIAASQEKDGYLFPARTINPANPAPGVGPSRWVYENGSHELYNSGHLYEAAVAHFQATGKRTLLDVAIRNANLVRATFGPTARRAVPGHEEIELALPKLFRVTGNRNYLELAKFFTDERGKPHDTEPYPEGPFAMYNGREYKQDHLPVLEQPIAVGHAVRAVYLYSGMTDIAAFFADAAYRRAVERLWTDVVSKRMYLTGGVGSRAGVEAFGDDYELPNRRAYTETCASIGNFLWNHRLFLLTGDARYLDAAELILYNGLLSGVSLAGDRFFYQNPLESEGSRERSPYFDVACCPANLARALAQLPGLLYAQDDANLYLGLYAASRVNLKVRNRTIRIVQETRYPFDGTVRLRIEPDRPVEFTLKLRIPGWARNELLASDLYKYTRAVSEQPQILIGEQKLAAKLDRGFAEIRRTWKRGDIVELRLPTPVRRVVSHQGIKENRGRVALARGPLVYCVEAADNKSRLSNLTVSDDADLGYEFRAGLLGGVPVIVGKEFTAVPYYAWANRGKGEMMVWIRDSRQE
jgi:DUF1680 family protein